MNAIQFPLTRVAIGLTFGILFARYCPLLPMYSLLLLSVLLLLFISLFYSVKKRPKLQFWFGLSVFLLSIGCGISSYVLDRESNHPNHYLHQLNTPTRLDETDLVLREKLKSTAQNLRFLAEVKYLNHEHCIGKVLIQFDKNDFAKTPLFVGRQMRIVAAVKTKQPPANPSGFDYWKYLEQKNIYGQIFAKSQNTQLQTQPLRDLRYYADQLRLRAMNELQKSGINVQVAQVLAALTVGQQQEIAPEIINDYQSAGAVHILSVSGLHVGFIVLFLNFILKFLPKNRKTRWLKLSITLLSLWGFALLAGLSASVIRSVTMYSFVAVGLYLKRRTNIFHTLLVSLMLILLVSPSLLFDVGLQLSYTALFFILWLQPVFDDFYTPQNKLIKYIWQIITVSLAAQIGTLPLSLYYFHQFPGLFLLTNLLVLPLIGLIMAVGVPLMMSAALGWVPQIGLTLITLLTQTLNSIVKTIASAQSFVLKNIPFNFWMLLTVYILIVCCVIALKKRQIRQLKWVFACILLVQLSIAISLGYAQQKRVWLILHQKKASVIINQYGRKIDVYCQGKISEAVIQNYATNEFIQQVNNHPIQPLARFKNYKIAVVDASNAFSKNIPADIFFLCNGPKINLDRILQDQHPKMIVADGSNYPSTVERWEISCQKQKIPFHYTGKKGFFELSD